MEFAPPFHTTDPSIFLRHWAPLFPTFSRLLFEPSIDKGSKNLTNYKQRPNRELRNVQNAEKEKRRENTWACQMAVLKSLFPVIPCEAYGLQCTV